VPNVYEIATRRFELISFLLDPSLTDAQREAAWRERCAEVSRSTLYRWLKDFREHGYLGLLPRTRSDRGETRYAGTATWIAYAIGLLYEQPDRSLTQVAIYLKNEFPDYELSASTLRRHLHQHPAFRGIEALRSTKKKKLRSLYEASHPHEGWQLDGKGKFPVHFIDGTRVEVTVLTVLDDHSRAVLAAVVALTESSEAAIAVIAKAMAKWGLPERIQFDRGSAFDSHAFRNGLAALGIHRNFVKARSPEWEGKIEAYHRSLDRWFVRELRAQEVVDMEHLQQLLEAVLELVYNPHHHREIGTSPERKLAGRCSSRQVSLSDIECAFLLETKQRSDPKTGEIRLPTGSYRVPSLAHAGKTCTLRYHPVQGGRVVLVTKQGEEIALRPFVRKPLSSVPTQAEKRGNGQLQKLVDRWQGKERPLAQPGFGLPEVFAELAELIERPVPGSEREAQDIVAFNRQHGPLARDEFRAACKRSKKALGPGHALKTYLSDLQRQMATDGASSKPDSEEDPS
jgi:putative transposase